MKRNVKTIYSQKEIEELRALIRLRVKADRTTQKSIRGKMRNLGFYGSEFGIFDCQESDLDRLIRNGSIKVIGEEASEKFIDKSISCTSVKSHPATQIQVPRLESVSAKEAENALIGGPFVSVHTLSDHSVPDTPGLYCIKLRKGIALPAKYGKVREDGIIYIGLASTSLHKRFWRQELNHHGAATFFRGIGAVLGYLPPKGSLYGKKTGNYKFSEKDTEAIRKWIRQSLLVNWIPFSTDKMSVVEEELIKKYRPLMNSTHNPTPSQELAVARERCREYARSK